MGILLYGKTTIVVTLDVWVFSTMEDGTITQSRLCVIVKSRVALAHTSIVAIWVTGMSTIESGSIGVVPHIEKSVAVQMSHRSSNSQARQYGGGGECRPKRLFDSLGKFAARGVNSVLLYGTIDHYAGTMSAL